MHRTAKQQQIIQANLLAASKTKAQLNELLLQYQILQEEVAFQRELHQVERGIYLIQEDEFQRQEGAPSDFLQAKRSYLLQQQSVKAKEQQLEILKLEILLTAHQKVVR